LLISDGAGELIETKLQRQLLARGCKHEVAARGEHHVNGPAERAIQELDTMMRESIHESNIPFKEDVYGFTPDVESLPVVGYFACLLRRLKLGRIRSLS